MSKKSLSLPEIEALVGSREIAPFLNPRNDLYRERNMKTSPPSRGEAIDLMTENPNLIRRPLLVMGEEILFGFDEEAYRRAAQAGGK
jgi:arsenate reductase (glutaredoxin)